MEKNITNNEPNNIYSKIIDNKYIALKFNQIVLGTKKLITNSTNFKDYSKEYEEVTKITTFKSPDEDYFPLLKNEEFVSLGRIKYSYDSKKNKNKKPKLISSLFRNKKMKKFSFTNKSTNENKKNNTKTININTYRKNNLHMSINNLTNDTNDTYNNTLSINRDNKNNTILSRTKISNNKIHNRNYFSVDSNTSKNNIKLDIETNSSSISNMQQNTNLNNKDILLSPMSISTQTSFFNKNKIKKLNGKSMNYYRNNKSRNSMLIIKKNLATIFKHKKSIYNNRVLLRDILLEEKNYSNLKYEPEKIFLSPEHYNDYIRMQMILIKKKNLVLKAPPKFEKIFENSKFGKPKLTLNSISIEFKQKYCFDNKKFNKNDKQIFTVPFEYIPLFYFNHLSKLKELLVSIFYLDDTFSTFYAKYDNLGYVLRNSNEFKEENEYKDSKKDIYKKAFTYKLQISHSQTLKAGTSIVRNFKRPEKNKDSFKLIDIFNTEYNFNQTPNYCLKFLNNQFNPNRNKDKIYFNNKNIFEFIWLTPSYQYLVTIKTPEISFIINGIEIKKNIDIELLFYLSEHNFQNWDFYVIEYLFSYFDFIYIVQHFFSASKPKDFYNLKYHYNFRNNVINLTQEKKFKYSKNNTKLEYIFTNDNLENHIKILHNYKLFVFNKKINPYYQFCFHLNFIQMKSLYSASKKQGIKYLIEKIIIIDKDNMKIKLNYEYLNNFCKDDLNILEPLIPSTIPIKGNKYNFNINDTKFCLFYPILETIRYNIEVQRNQRNHNCFESNFEEEIKDGMNMNILESLFKNEDAYTWPSIIEFIDNKEKIKKQKRRTSILLPHLNQNESHKSILLNPISSKKLNILYLNQE